MISRIKKLAKENAEWTKNIRHHLHANPELSFEEIETSNYIKNKLNEIGIEFEDGYVKTGIVATIKGKNPNSKTIGLRADMDALPILETNEIPYKSKNNGVMHACGHDVHSASLLGVAKVLNELKNDFDGTIKFIFQPGEEKLPGGASLMIEDGVLNKHKMDAMFAQHVTPQIDTGKVGFKPGMFMASTDEIYIEVIGQGGHAAMPELYNNPLLISAKLLLALNEAFTREQLLAAGIKVPTVLAFGKIIGNGATNVIPEKTTLEGTFRTFDEIWRKNAHQKIMDICEKIAIENNAEINCNIIVGYPFLVNNESLTEKAKTHAIAYLGKDNVIDLEHRMTAEDFAFFSQKIPSTFYRIGTGNKEKKTTSGVHTSNFNIDEDSLEIMIGLMSYLTIEELKN